MGGDGGRGVLGVCLFFFLLLLFCCFLIRLRLRIIVQFQLPGGCGTKRSLWEP